MIKNIKPLQFILSVSLSIALTIIISIFITTAQTSSNSYLKDDLQVKTGATFNASATLDSNKVKIDSSTGNVGIGNTPGTTYKLDVSGKLNATTIYQNNTALGALATQGICSSNQILKVSGSSWTCSSDVDTDTNSFTAGAQSCAVGKKVSGISANGTITCSNDIDTNTTYIGGTGISISGTTITNTGITSLTPGTGISISGTTISANPTTYDFGGVYRESTGNTGYTCVKTNKYTGSCSCPSGFTAFETDGETYSGGSKYHTFICVKS